MRNRDPAVAVRVLSRAYDRAMGKSSRGLRTRSSVAAARCIGIAAAVVVALSGCSMLGSGTGSAAPSRSATATSSATATTAAADVTFAARPDQAGMPSCTSILPAGLTARLVPAIADDDPLTRQVHVEPSTLAVEADGGLSCNIDNGVAFIDSVSPGKQGDPMRNGITAMVLPDASDELDALLADPAVSAPVSCTASDAARVSCTADVHAGSAWLDISLERVQDADGVTPEGMQDRFQALVTHATSVVAESPLGTADVPHESGDPGPSICVADRVNAVTTTPLADPYAATDFTQDIIWVSLERAGAEWCSFVTTGRDPYAPIGAVYGTIPKGSWIVEARIDAGLIDADDRIDLDGLGTGDAAFRTCDDTLCTVDVVHSGNWTRYLLQKSVAPDTSAAIETWARSSFGH